MSEPESPLQPDEADHIGAMAHAGEDSAHARGAIVTDSSTAAMAAEQPWRARMRRAQEPAAASRRASRRLVDSRCCRR